MSSASVHTLATRTQYLDGLYSKYGYFVTNNSYVISKDKAVTDKIFEKIRNGGASPRPSLARNAPRPAAADRPRCCRAGEYHPSVGGMSIKYVRDLTGDGLDTSQPDNKPTLPTSSSHMITFTMEGG